MMSKQSELSHKNHKFPKPPFPDQHIDPPGLETEMVTLPQYQAPNYREAGKL